MRVGATQYNSDGSEQRYGANRGWVYIVSNPSMSGLLKIGKTTTSVKQRLNELSRPPGVPTPFELEISIKVRDCDMDETLAHKALAEYRVEKKEFFKVSVDTAVAEILPAIGDDYRIDGYRPANKYIYDIEEELRKRKLEVERQKRAAREKRKLEDEKKAKAEARARRIVREIRKNELEDALTEAKLKLQRLGARPTKPDDPNAVKFCNKVASRLDNFGDTTASKIISFILSIVIMLVIISVIPDDEGDLPVIPFFIIYSIVYGGLVWMLISFLTGMFSKITRRFAAILWDSKKCTDEYNKANHPFEIVDHKIDELTRELNELKREHELT